MSSIRELRDRVASARDGRTLRLLLVDIFSELRRTAPSEVGSLFDEKMEILLRGFFARDVHQAIADILKNLSVGYPPVKDDILHLADQVEDDLYGPSIRSHVTQAIDLMTGGFVRITKSGSNVTYSPDVSYVLVGESLLTNVTPNAGYIWASENPIVVYHGSSSVTPVKSGDRYYTISILQVQHDISITTNVIPDQTMYGVSIGGEGHTHATYTDRRTQVPEGESYTQRITVASGYDAPNGPSVTMGGVAQTVTNLGNKTWECSIASVTGDINVYIEIFPVSSRTATVKFIENGVSTTRTPDVDFGTDLIPEADVKYIKIEYDSDGPSPGTPEAYYCKSMEIVRTTGGWEHRSYIGVDGESYALSGANMNVTFGYSGGATIRVTPGQLVGGDTAHFNLRSYFNMTISDTIPS